MAVETTDAFNINTDDIKKRKEKRLRKINKFFFIPSMIFEGIFSILVIGIIWSQPLLTIGGKIVQSVAVAVAVFFSIALASETFDDLYPSEEKALIFIPVVLFLLTSTCIVTAGIVLNFKDAVPIAFARVPGWTYFACQVAMIILIACLLDDFEYAPEFFCGIAIVSAVVLAVCLFLPKLSHEAKTYYNAFKVIIFEGDQQSNLSSDYKRLLMSELNIKEDRQLRKKDLVYSTSVTIPQLEEYDSELDLSEFINMRTFDCTNLENIESCIVHIKDLRKLVARESTITPTVLTAISEFKSLCYLDLSFCDLTDEDLKYLTNLGSITHLDISGNPITELGYLFSYKILSDNQYSYSDINNSMLSTEDAPAIVSVGLTKLKELYASNCELTDIAEVENLKKLRVCNFSYNNITDITGINNCKKLRHVFLNNNSITDISALSECSNLDWLHIQKNLINDYSPIYDLKLSDLTIDSNISDIDKGVIENYLPKSCTVSYV